MHNTSAQNTSDWSSLIFAVKMAQPVVAPGRHFPHRSVSCFAGKQGNFHSRYSVAYRSSVRYRLNYGLKGPSNPKQPTNQLIEAIYTQNWISTHIIPYAKLTIVNISSENGFCFILISSWVYLETEIVPILKRKRHLRSVYREHNACKWFPVSPGGSHGGKKS